MGVSLQTYRMRIGTFGQTSSSGNIKNRRKQTYKENFRKPLFLLLMLNVMLIILITFTQCYQPSLIYPQKASGPAWSSPWTSSSSAAGSTWCSPPWTSQPLPSAFTRGSNSMASVWCSPPWTEPPWPSACTISWLLPPWTTSPWPSACTHSSCAASVFLQVYNLSSSLLSAREFTSDHFFYSSKSPQLVDVNFNSRYVNGKRRRNGIRMGHINLGSGYLVNKMNSIETIIGGYKPHILGISESCFKKFHDKNDVQIDDYNVFFSKTLDNESLNASRISVFTHKDLTVKERADLMNDSFSSVWLEVGLPRSKKIIICNLYRDWQYLDQDSDASLATAAQLSRWLSFIEQWERALQDNREVHVMGDTNLDFLKWDDPNQPGSHQRHRLHKLSHAIFDRVFPFGFVQMVSVATRFWPGQEPSGLDHWYTNKPGKLSDIQVNNQGGSDHKLIFGIRYSKAIISKPKIIKKRSYKNFVPVDFLAKIRSISWLDIYLCEDLETATDLFTQKVTTILDEMAPIKTYQVRKKYAPWLSPALKSEIKDRDAAQHKAQESGSQEDWKKYKKFRNSVNNKLKGAKTRWQKEKLGIFSRQQIYLEAH